MEVKVLRKEHIERAGIATSDFGRSIPIPNGKYSTKDGYVFTSVSRFHVDAFLPKPLYKCTTSDGTTIILQEDLVKSLDTMFFKTSIEELEEVLQERYGDDAWVEKSLNKFYIHYKEIDITNTFEVMHKIKDLVVECTYMHDGRDIYRIAGINGRRFTVTPKELAIDYFHSHLNQKYDRIGPSPFCLGSSPLATFTNKDFSANIISLEAFLIQLDAYLRWESVEGKPHRFITNVLKASDTNTGEAEIAPFMEVNLSNLALTKIVAVILDRLANSGNPDAIKSIKTSGGVAYYLNLIPPVIEIITSVLRNELSSSYSYQFDRSTKTYVTGSALVDRKNVFERTNTLTNPRTKQTLRPKVTDSTGGGDIVQVIHPALMVLVIRAVNLALTEVVFYE